MSLSCHGDEEEQISKQKKKITSARQSPCFAVHRGTPSLTAETFSREKKRRKNIEIPERK
jgi:hypothetical protein